jgi:hypothetical protein
MTAAQKERRTATAEVDEEPNPSPYLARVLEEVAQANAQREEAAKRQRPAPDRALRPFAYD